MAGRDGHGSEQLEEFRRTMAESKELLKDLPEHFDEFTPAEQAWLIEHLEMLIVESQKLRGRIATELMRRNLGGKVQQPEEHQDPRDRGQ